MVLCFNFGIHLFLVYKETMDFCMLKLFCEHLLVPEGFLIIHLVLYMDNHVICEQCYIFVLRMCTVYCLFLLSYFSKDLQCDVQKWQEETSLTCVSS